MNRKEKENIKANMQAIFAAEIDQWFESQGDQIDGFEYERSYVETMRSISSKAFQVSLGEVPQDKNQKKTSDQSGEHKCF